MTILSSHWVIKTYPADGRLMHFLIGTSQINMLNTALYVTNKQLKDLTIEEKSPKCWHVEAKGDDAFYIIEQREDRPQLPPDEPFSVQDMRIPDTVPRKAGPKQLSFF